MPVRQLSSSESSVGDRSPRSVSVSSRLRWVAGGSSSNSLARWTVSELTWASARPGCARRRQQRGGGGVGRGQVLRIEAGQRGDAQLLAELALAQACIELPGGTGGERGPGLAKRRRGVVPVEQDLGRRQAGQPAGQLAFAALGHAELAAGDAEPGQPVPPRCTVHGQQQRVGAVVQQLAVGDGAGRDDAHHLALDRPLAVATSPTCSATATDSPSSDSGRGSSRPHATGTPAITTGSPRSGRAW
jgi:hypothetical protein